MTHNDFVKLKQAQLDIMDEIHRLCLVNNIRYYMIGGTGIGAVRHKGFIPWDVDIDIGMLREDYDQFKIICEDQLSERFLYYDYHSVKNYNRPHAIVSIRNTKLMSFYDQYNPFENLGIYVDILPLDNAPDEMNQRKEHEKEILKCRQLVDWKKATIYNSNILKKILKKAWSCVLFPFSLYKLNERYDKCLRKYDGADTSNVCSMAGRYPYEVECVPRDFFGEPVLMEFEGREYYAPAKIHEYLTHIYGNYMQLPPKEQQEENINLFTEVVFDR